CGCVCLWSCLGLFGFYLFVWHSRHFEAEGDIVADTHVRIERVGLEHHRQSAFRGGLIDGIDAVDHDLAAGRVLEPGNEAQERRLPAAGRSDEDDELAIKDFKTGAGDDDNIAEPLLDVLQDDRTHYFTAPNVSPRTSCFWANQPSTRMGAIAMVEAAESLAQNRPSGLE